MFPPMTSAVTTPSLRRDSLRLTVTCVVLSLLAASVAFAPKMGYVAMSMTLLGLFVAYIRLRPAAQNGDLFEIIIPFAILNFLYFGVGTLYLVFRPEAVVFPSLQPFLGPALALEILGCLCFIVGYAGFFRETRPSPIARYEPATALASLAPTAIGCVGLSVHGLQEAALRSGSISPAISFVQQFGVLFHVGWFLCWYQFWTGRLGRSKVAVLIAASCCALIVIYFTLGSKSLTIMVLGMPAVAYYQVKRRVPWKTVIAVGLIAVFVIFPLYNTFRFTDRDLGTARRMDLTIGMAGQWDQNQFAEVSVFAALKRMTLVTSVAAILSDTGRWVDYRYGETLILAPIGLFIPRFLWPDKPNIGIGWEFGNTFRFTHAMDLETEVSPSLLGEFYWNFSIPGVIVGMMFLGMGYRWYYQRYGVGTGYDPMRKAVYAGLLPTALQFDANFGMVIAGFAKALAIMVVFVILMRRIGWLRFRDPEGA